MREELAHSSHDNKKQDMLELMRSNYNTAAEEFKHQLDGIKSEISALIGDFGDDISRACQQLDGITGKQQLDADELTT